MRIITREEAKEVAGKFLAITITKVEGGYPEVTYSIPHDKFDVKIANAPGGDESVISYSKMESIIEKAKNISSEKVFKFIQKRIMEEINNSIRWFGIEYMKVNLDWAAQIFSIVTGNNVTSEDVNCESNQLGLSDLNPDIDIKEVNESDFIAHTYYYQNGEDEIFLNVLTDLNQTYNFGVTVKDSKYQLLGEMKINTRTFEKKESFEF